MRANHFIQLLIVACCIFSAHTYGQEKGGFYQTPIEGDSYYREQVSFAEKASVEAPKPALYTNNHKSVFNYNYQLELNPNGSFTYDLRKNGDLYTVSGKYSVKGSTFVFSDIKGNAPGLVTASGKLLFKYENDILQIKGPYDNFFVGLLSVEKHNELKEKLATDIGAIFQVLVVILSIYLICRFFPKEGFAKFISKFDFQETRGYEDISPVKGEVTINDIESSKPHKLYTSFQEVLIELETLKKKLPEPIYSNIKSIINSSHQIIGSMKTDPRDVLEGKIFLERYLKAVLLITSRYRSIQEHRESPVFQSVSNRASSVLAQLADAFTQKSEQLQANDADDLVTEINVTSRLLSMDGFKHRNADPD